MTPSPTSSEIEPHTYSPDYQAMGDCRVCGHGPEKSWHRQASEGEAMLKLADEIERKTSKPCGEAILASLEARLVVPALRAAAQTSGVREALRPFAEWADRNRSAVSPEPMDELIRLARKACDAYAALSPDTPREGEK